MGELQSYQHFPVKRTEPTLALQVQILKPTTIPRLLCFLIGILIFADYQNWAGLCKPNIAWSFLVRGHGVSGGFPIRFAPWQNNKIHWRPICTYLSVGPSPSFIYLGSGRTIFLLARAAGVHFDFSMAIKQDTSARTASRSAIVQLSAAGLGWQGVFVIQ